nr:TPA_asm: hypothetical protein HUJ06_012102 [Nelumbo nucifera]
MADPETCFSNFRAEYELMDRHSPAAVLGAAIKASMNEAQKAMEVVNKFTVLSMNPREQMAVEDCKELLDFSVSELQWSLAQMDKTRSSKVKDVHSESNLHAWLSAALSNQDTCIEGFEGTNGRILNYIKGSINQVTQLIYNVLTMYHKMHSLPLKPPFYDPQVTGSLDFPTWMADVDPDGDFLAAGPQGIKVNAIVAQDGSGQFRSIMEAVNEAPDYSWRRYVIYVKKGIYKENVEVKKKKTNIMFVGDGIGVTVVTGNRNFGQGWTTFRTPTVAVTGRGFIAKYMTFRNTAGPENHQAVALRVDSDRSAFYECSIEGYQDTLYSHSLRQFYRNCDIYGTIDFIFGNGQAVFQNCNIYTRQPLPLQKVTITAQGRKSPTQSTGFSIQDCRVLATRPTYLGRPWKEYSRTVFMKTYMTSMVRPEGWLEWAGNFALSTLYYGEYKSEGPGGSPTRRVKWPGFHIINDASTVFYFSVDYFIDGLRWLPRTGISYTPYQQIL